MISYTDSRSVGVIASHEEYPIERIKLDHRNKWLGSVSHDECIKLTDVEDLFENSDDEEEEKDEEAHFSVAEDVPDEDTSIRVDDDAMSQSVTDSSEAEVPKKKSRKRRKAQSGMGNMGKSEARSPSKKGFFGDL